MKNRVLAGAIMSAFFIITACKSDEEKVAEQPVLTVNQHTLTAKEFAKRLAVELKPFDALSAKHPQNVTRAKESVLEKFVNETLVEEWAAKNGLVVSETQLETEIKKIRSQYPDDISFRGAFAKEDLSLESWKGRLRKSLRPKNHRILSSRNTLRPIKPSSRKKPKFTFGRSW
jgi:peptidyl-prolyl cis-trans isomerase C